MVGPSATVSLLTLLCMIVSVLSQGRWTISWVAIAMPGVLVVTAAEFSWMSAPIIIGFIFAMATAVAWYGMLPSRFSVLIWTAISSGIVVGVALATSRAIGDVMPYAAPLIMTLIITGLEVLGSRKSPYGEWGALAHSQARLPWALSVAKPAPHMVTAILVLISSTFGYAYMYQSILMLTLATCAVLTLGIIGYLGQRKTKSLGLCAAGILENDDIFFMNNVRHFVAGTLSSSEHWYKFQEASRLQHKLLLEQTRALGADKTDLIVWAEGAGLICAEDYASALESTAEVALETSTYVVASWMVLHRVDAMMDNFCTVFDPSGKIVLTCVKNFPVPGIEANRTITHPQKELEAIDTPFGRIAILICFDADHAESWKQVIACDADIVAIPASDWPEISALHADMALLRAQSADVSIVRPARNGKSLIAGRRGILIAQKDHRYTNASPVLGSL